MKGRKQFFSRHQSLTAAISVLASVVAVVGFVYGATTIGTNISVDGTLTVTGASTLTGNVTAAGTLGVTGASTLSTTTVQGSFNTGAITATGTAASSFNNLTVNGTLGVTGVSTFTGGLASLSVTGASTLSTTTVQGYFNTGIITATSSITTNNFTVTGVCTGCSNAFAYPFTPTSNLGLIMSATTTNIFASGAAGFYASSSSVFASTTVQGSFNAGTITATGTVASSFNNTITNASSTHIGTTNVSGAFIAGNTAGVASSTPAKALGVAGDAFLGGSGTTTLYIKTAGAGASGAGSCIELLDGNGTVKRLYVNPGNTLTIEAGTCK